MDKVTKVCYVDASYSTRVENVHLRPRVHTAFGYVADLGKSLIVSFIQKEPGWISTILKRKFIVKGLLIPKESLLSASNMHIASELATFTIGQPIKVWWRDVAYLANVYERSAHTMLTRGNLKTVEKDYIMIESPTTSRIWPWPHRAHIPSATLVMVPIQLIRKVKK